MDPVLQDALGAFGGVLLGLISSWVARDGYSTTAMGIGFCIIGYVNQELIEGWFFYFLIFAVGVLWTFPAFYSTRYLCKAAHKHCWQIKNIRHRPKPQKGEAATIDLETGFSQAQQKLLADTVVGYST